MNNKIFYRLLTVLSIFITSVASADTYKNLPAHLLTKAISTDVVYDEDFDYTKLKKTHDLIFSYQESVPVQVTPKAKVVDHVVVYKAAHKMVLLKDNHTVCSFWIALSNKPLGKKQFEGDKRTPEGTYTLDYVKTKSYFYKAMHISYPNMEDRAFAKSQGRKPGGMIMVHGQPPSKGEYHESVQRTDWTDGCIALLNPDIDKFLSLVDVGTPITIHP